MKVAIKVQPIFKDVMIRGILCSSLFLLCPSPAYSQVAPSELSPEEKAQQQVIHPEPAVLRDPEPAPAAKPSKPQAKPKKKEQVLLKDLYLKENERLSKEIDKAAEDVDLMLAGKKLTNKPNESTIRVENSVYHREGGELQTGTHFGIAIRLPNLEKKWQVKFTSYDEKEEDRRIDQRQFRTEPKDENYGASFVLFKQLGKIKTTYQPRLELKDPLDVSHVLTFESDYERTGYRVDPKVEFFARPQKGVGVFTALPYTFILSDRWAMVVQQEVEYQNSENRFNHNSGLSFSERISDWASLSYAVAAASDNREAYHLVQWGFAVSWQHMVLKDALSYSVAPTWDFIKARNFKGVAGLRLNVDLIF